MNSFSVPLIDHTDPAVPAHLRHSFALALAEKVASTELDGVTKGEQALEEGSEYRVPATVLVGSAAAVEWRDEWVKTMNALTLPETVSAESIRALPYMTPSLLVYLMTKEKNPRPAKSPKKDRDAAATRPAKRAGKDKASSTPDPAPAVPGAGASAGEHPGPEGKGARPNDQTPPPADQGEHTPVPTPAHGDPNQLSA